MYIHVYTCVYVYNVYNVRFWAYWSYTMSPETRQVRQSKGNVRRSRPPGSLSLRVLQDLAARLEVDKEILGIMSLP